MFVGDEELESEAGCVTETRFVTLALPVEGGRTFEWTVDDVKHVFTAAAGAAVGDSAEFSFDVVVEEKKRVKAGMFRALRDTLDAPNEIPDDQMLVDMVSHLSRPHGGYGYTDMSASLATSMRPLATSVTPLCTSDFCVSSL